MTQESDKIKNEKVKKLFGTDGIRTKVGEFPLDNENIIKLGLSIGQWAKEKYGKTGKNINILIGHDTRISCESIKKDLAQGLLAYELTIHDAQVVPTPAIVKIINDKQDFFDFGIIITASHNQYQDNGIKIVDSKTGKLDQPDQDKITEIFYGPEVGSDSSKLACPTKPWRSRGHYKTFDNAQQEYIKIITSYFKKNILENITVVLDCANGATYQVAPEIFKQLGAKVITLANNPDGKNINKDCGSTHPENLQKYILESKNAGKINIGLAFDGDGDRIAVVGKDGSIKNGDDILCLISQHPDYEGQKTIVGTIMTNHGLELFLNKNGKKLVRTNVGDKYVCKEMNNNNLLLGGEESGHIVLRDYLSCSDGIFAAIRLLEALKLTNNWNLDTFERTPQITINVPVKEKRDLNEPELEKIILKYKNKLKNGRLIVRYSGTENLLRVMTESSDGNLARDVCSDLAREFAQELNK